MTCEATRQGPVDAFAARLIADVKLRLQTTALKVCPQVAAKSRVSRNPIWELHMKLIGRSHEARREEVRRRLEETYARVVRNVKLRLLRPDGEARDLVHNVAVTLLRNGAHHIDNWVAYQTTAAVNEFNKEQENRKLVYFSELSEEEQRRIVEEVPGPTKSPADLAAEHELIDMALEEVANLPFKQRAVLMMSCSGYKHDEIATTLGLKSADTSRSHLRHALNTLRERLRARGFFDCTF